ncbi:helix-turn-helix transcriptional regulator [Variovorax sp. J22R133]|uniref:helix-turn-helix domain-containing protein n=1 Tax=Variovorax brevis TaxID=3053503 RepID=UPI0025787414|nr:helix-turn-helix transcriptional regulator [Variovorax sp. J22R133]MDM0114988.1 helix-turn-helix transcriptional regulator [Variovorax sp. J22R133]
MSEVVQLLSTIKRQLKSQGLTYRDVARALDLSEPSVKRLFASERLTVERLAQISELLGFTMAELLQEAGASLPRLSTMTLEQEQQLVSDIHLLLVAVCVFNHWTVMEIVVAYRMTKAECLKRVLVLDRMGVIDLLPGDRIRLRVARDFDWLPDGPIRHFFLTQGLGSFLDCRFERPGESLDFAHGMLTGPAQAEFQVELRRLRVRLAALHQESAGAPLSQKRGTGVLLATREWEPAVFAKLRRDARSQAPAISP